MNATPKGLYEKFSVTRNDGRSAPGEKHDGCEYFVLDLSHDKHAMPALAAYAQSCADEFPELAADLRAKVRARSCLRPRCRAAWSCPPSRSASFISPKATMANR
jgi:hypothetical protein